MAIIIEEEKKHSNLTGLIGWLVIFVIIIVAAYYVFFAAPQLVIITPTDTISEIAPIAQAALNVDTILQSSAFKALNPTTVPAVSTTTGGSGGRPNPFIAP